MITRTLVSLVAALLVVTHPHLAIATAAAVLAGAAGACLLVTVLIVRSLHRLNPYLRSTA